MADTLIDVRVFADGVELARAAAEDVVRRVVEAVHLRGRAAVALSGGSTPRRLFSLLVDPTEAFRDRIDWQALHLFWTDERHVPPDHPESNFRMARETLLDAVPIPRQNVHRIRGEESAASHAAALYEEELRAFFAGDSRFDLVLLGMGADAHTASLFPGTEAVRERVRWVAAPWVEKLGSFRITLTPALLERARALMFLVQGAEKAEALRAVLEGEIDPDRRPAQGLRALDGETVWLVDASAAGGLRMDRTTRR